MFPEFVTVCRWWGNGGRQRVTSRRLSSRGTALRLRTTPESSVWEADEWWRGRSAPRLGGRRSTVRTWDSEGGTAVGTRHWLVFRWGLDARTCFWLKIPEAAAAIVGLLI